MKILRSTLFILTLAILATGNLCATEHEYTLKTMVDNLNDPDIQISIQAHQKLVAHIRTMSQVEMEELFSSLADESTLKMALRLVYAKKHQMNLNVPTSVNLDCVYFINNITNWVNGIQFMPEHTPLLNQANLKHVLPLLEPLIEANVTSLSIDGNRFNYLTEMPDEIGNLVNLQKLSLFRNKITKLPDQMGKLINLRVLNLDANQLTQLPDWISNLTSLQQLNLSTNQLTKLPDQIGKLINLQGLYLLRNDLTEFPDQICNLANLRELRLDENKLTVLPEKIGNLVNIQRLGLGYNELTHLPEQINKLVNLQWLYLEYNQLTHLPEQISKLNLQGVYLDYNQFPEDVKASLKLKGWVRD